MLIQALCDDYSLWQKYVEDFTHKKLRLEYGSTGISDKILRVVFWKLEERDALQRLAILHVYVRINKLNLAQVISILRNLDKMEVTVSVSAEEVHFPVQHGVEYSWNFLVRSEALSVFITDTLFGAIAGIGMSCSEPTENGDGENGEGPAEQLRLWFNVYSGVVSHQFQQQPNASFESADVLVSELTSEGLSSVASYFIPLPDLNEYLTGAHLHQPVSCG